MFRNQREGENPWGSEFRHRGFIPSCGLLRPVKGQRDDLTHPAHTPEDGPLSPGERKAGYLSSWESRDAQISKYAREGVPEGSQVDSL